MQRSSLIVSFGLMLVIVALLAISLTPAAAQRGGARPTRTSVDTQATLQAASTQVAQTGAGAQATLQAAATQVMPTAAAAQATLSAIASNSSVVISQSSDSATISYSFPEATISAVISAAYEVVGYPGTSADLIPGGIVVTIPNITYGQWTGTLVATYTVGVTDGSLTVSLISVTVAGHNAPTSAFASLTDALSAGLNNVIAASSDATAIGYTIDALVITDTQMTVTVTFSYSDSGDLPDVTPAFTPPPC